MFANPSKKSKREKRPKNKKRARLIIRNLAFTVTEEALRAHFSPYGSIEEIKLLKRPDGKLIGCGFVQFERRQSGAKAIHHLSGKPLLGRPIIVDWAVSKNTFGDTKPKKTPGQPAKNKCSNNDDEVHDAPEVPSSNPCQEKENNDTESEHDSQDESESEESNKLEKVEDQKPDIKTRPADSHDVHEGKTIFLKNVPFNCTNDELKAYMETIGPVFYAVTCIDPLTEHSKGTAFAKFKFKKDADKCLETELKLKNSIMEAFPALEKKKLMNPDRDKHPDKKKDNRNLYLIKEGVVIAGTKAAEGVSMSDIKKRLELELWKNNMLRNLNMFVSRDRLIVHNLPSSYDDRMLRELFKKHAPPKSRIVEAKVMRNLRQLDTANKPISKGYGFVSFTDHRSALAALRNINNNPTAFNKNKRPIVAFSIENRVVHKIKQKRTEKSKVNNSLCPDWKKPKIGDSNNKKPEKHIKKRTRSDNVPNFAGIEAHPGAVKLLSKRKVAFQEAVHQKNVNETKKDTKRKRFKEETRKEKKRDPKIKSKKCKNQVEKEFNQLVEKYKKNIPNISLKKWYEAD